MAAASVEQNAEERCEFGVSSMNDKDESEPQAASKLDQCAHSRQVHRKATEDTTNHQDRTLGGLEIHGCLQFLWHVGDRWRAKKENGPNLPSNWGKKNRIFSRIRKSSACRTVRQTAPMNNRNCRQKECRRHSVATYGVKNMKIAKYKL
jgi:hypothetical protein